MRKSSGNGTSAIQVLYLLWNFPQVHRVKCGITGNLKKRRKDISESTFGFVFPVFFIVVPFAYQIEQSIHKVFKKWNRPLSGSGGSEWFAWYTAPFIALAMAGYQILFVLALLLVALLLAWMCDEYPDEPIKAVMRLLKHIANGF